MRGLQRCKPRQKQTKMSTNDEKFSTVVVPSEEEVIKEKERLQTQSLYRKTIVSTISVLLVVAAIAALISTLLLSVLQISGSSMEPTLTDRNIVVLLRGTSPKRGDIIGFYWNNKLLVKRVVGLPGDIVSMDDVGNLYINGELLNEGYITEESRSQGQYDIDFPFVVPEEEFFVLGDNRLVSVDSRAEAIGCVRRDQMIGRVFCEVWPKLVFDFDG